MDIEKPIVVDILDQTGTPALSSTSDMPVVETKPDASNEGKPPEAKAAPESDVEDEDKTPSESATGEQPEKPSADDSPKKAQGVQKRLDELTRQREDEKRARLAAEERLDKTLAALEKAVGDKGEPKKEFEADPEPSRPVRTTFDDIEAYESALLDYSDQRAAWVAKREVKAARADDARKQHETMIAQQEQQAQAAFKARREKAVERYSDFDAVTQNPDITVSPVIAQAIIHDDQGADFHYYFGKHPEEAARVSALNPYSQLVELGRISSKFDKPAETPAPKAEAKPAVSAAPKPIKPISQAASEPSKDLENMSMDEYAATRRRKEGWADPQKSRMRH